MEFFGNSVRAYIIAGSVLLGAVIINLILRAVMKRKEKVQPVIQVGIKKIMIPAVYLAAFYAVIRFLDFGEKINFFANKLFIVLAIFFVVRFFIGLVDFLMIRYIDSRQEEGTGPKLKPFLSIIHFILWIFGLVFLLNNLGFEISTLIAGLGITGIAVALGAQTVLKDLFSYFVVLLDRPFEVGDFIIFDDKLGAVEKIGIKSTRIKALGGEQLVVSNSDLTNVRIHNYKKMERRRVVFNFGVTYQTGLDQLKIIPEKIKEIIEGEENCTFDRCHFKSFGSFSLDFETVYYIGTADYTAYMDIQQRINLAIFEYFETSGVEFAYPTQTLFVAGSGN